jgi:hypothetical protein
MSIFETLIVWGMAVQSIVQLVSVIEQVLNHGLSSSETDVGLYFCVGGKIMRIGTYGSCA